MRLLEIKGWKHWRASLRMMDLSKANLLIPTNSCFQMIRCAWIFLFCRAIFGIKLFQRMETSFVVGFKKSSKQMAKFCYVFCKHTHPFFAAH